MRNTYQTQWIVNKSYCKLVEIVWLEIHFNLQHFTCATSNPAFIILFLCRLGNFWTQMSIRRKLCLVLWNCFLQQTGPHVSISCNRCRVKLLITCPLKLILLWFEVKSSGLLVGILFSFFRSLLFHNHTQVNTMANKI